LSDHCSHLNTEFVYHRCITDPEFINAWVVGQLLDIN